MIRKIQIEFMIIFLVIFGAPKNILFIIKVKIFFLIEWSYRSQLCWLLGLELLVVFEHVVQSLLDLCLYSIYS